MEEFTKKNMKCKECEFRRESTNELCAGLALAFVFGAFFGPMGVLVGFSAGIFLVKLLRWLLWTRQK